MTESKKYFLKTTLMIDGISYFTLVPLAIYILFFHGRLFEGSPLYSFIGLAISLLLSVIHTIIFRYRTIYRPLTMLYGEKEKATLVLQLFGIRRSYFDWFY